MFEEILNDFNPIIEFSIQDGVSVIVFDSNFIKDLNREPKMVYLQHNFFQKGGSISIECEQINFENDSEIKKLVLKTNINLIGILCTNNVKIEEKILLHQIRLVVGEPVEKFENLPNTDIYLSLKDKIADATAIAFESLNGNFINDSTKTAIDTSKSIQDGISPKEDKEIKNQKLRNFPFLKSRISKGIFIFLIGFFVAYFAFKANNSSSFRQIGAADMQNDPNAINAQVQLTRETLKSMGLDPSKVQSDLGCLAQ